MTTTPDTHALRERPWLGACSVCGTAKQEPDRCRVCEAGLGPGQNQRIIARSMSEADLLANVVEMAQRLGYLTMHIPDRLYALAATQGRYDALTGAESFPDLVLVHPDMGFVLFCELKRERRDPTPAQDAWLDLLTGRRTEVAVWRPSAWIDGTVEAVLRGDTSLLEDR